eukprot:gene4596-5878_t
MDKFTKVTGVAAPLMRQNVDTDLIIRIERLVDNVTREGLGPYAFEQIRFKPDGSEDPDCIFNQTPYRDAPIILSRENFGCGSSREGAVWALKGMGIKAVIAPYFGDIFNNNCFQNGALPIRVDAARAAELRTLLHASPGAKISIDLAAQTVTGPDGKTDRFEIDSFRKDCLLKGADEVTLTLGYDKDIKAFEAKQRQEMSWL